MNSLVYEILNATGYKCYPLQAPQNKKPPFVIYTLINRNFEVCSSGATDLEEVLYQIDIYSKIYNDCEVMAEAITGAINSATTFKAVLQSRSDSVEDGGKIYRSRINFNAWSN